MNDCLQLNPETGKWEPAESIPYYSDLRPLWLKVLEFPFRWMGMIRYDHFTAIDDSNRHLVRDWGKE